jgi:hypothetical protein
MAQPTPRVVFCSPILPLLKTVDLPPHWPPLALRLWEEFSGSTALFNNNDEGITVLTRVDGNAFSFNSIDLADLYPYDKAGYDFGITFYGLLGNGSSVSQTVTLDNLTGVQSYTFGSAFSNVLAVNWAQGDDFHQFDNVNAAPVPEPKSILLFGSGLTTLLGARKNNSGKFLPHSV